MKKALFLFVVCIFVSTFVSCSDTDASDITRVNVGTVVKENSFGKTVDEEYVRTVFDCARDIYQKNAEVILSDGTVISTVSAYKQSVSEVVKMNNDKRTAASAEYSKYLEDVFSIGLDMLMSSLGEKHIIDLTGIPETVNTPLPHYLVALDLEGTGYDNAYELLEAVRNGKEQFKDELLMISGITVSSYSENEDNMNPLYPSASESQIRHALRYGTDSTAE